MGQRASHASGNEQTFQVDLPRRAFRRHHHPRATHADGQPEHAEMKRRMRRFAMFADLADSDLAGLAAGASIHAYTAGEYLWHQGDSNRHVLFIEQGLAKTSRRNPGGLNRTYGLHGPGDSMGIYAIWSGMHYPTDAIAMNDGMTAICLDSATLLDFAAGHPGMADLLAREITHFTEAFMQKIDIVSAGTVAQRLATLMTLLVERYGVEKSRRSTRLPISLTLAQLGEIVDARVETVARTLSEWKRQGWLAMDANGCHFTRLDKVYGLLPG